MTSTTKGYILGAIAAVSYGTNPMFAVPLYETGLDVASVLTYRYLFATIILGIIMRLRGDRFRLTRRETGQMAILGIMFAVSSVLLFEAYNYMDVGLASTLLFVEPVFIAILLWACFRERISLWTIISIVICLAGIVLLSNPGKGAYVTATGVALVILSALSYALYMVAINKSRLRHMPGTTIAFYSLLFGMMVFAVLTRMFMTLKPIEPSMTSWVCVIGLSVFPTIVSLLTVAVALKHISSVAVSILGALEPITGVIIGVMLFGEHLTVKASAGIVLIICAVLTLVLKRDKQ